MNRYEMKKIAYGSDLKNRALQVLLYLIDRSNKEGTCFPAIPTIARELHIGVSTVKRALGELVEAGFIVKESRYRENKGQSSNLYTIILIENNERQKPELIDDEKQMGTVVTKSVANTELLNSLNHKRYEYRYNGGLGFCEIRLIHGVRNHGSDIISSLLEDWTGEEVNLIPP